MYSEFFCGLTRLASSRGHGFDHWSGKIPHTAEQVSLYATTTEARVPRVHAPHQEKPPQWEARALQPRAGPRSPQLEKACVQQRRPNAAKNQSINQSIHLLRKKKKLFKQKNQYENVWWLSWVSNRLKTAVVFILLKINCFYFKTILDQTLGCILLAAKNTYQTCFKSLMNVKSLGINLVLELFYLSYNWSSTGRVKIIQKTEIWFK